MQTVFITSAGINSERWTAAFPEAEVITSEKMLDEQINPESIVWVLLDGEWQEILEYVLGTGAKVIAMTLSENIAQAKEVVSVGASAYIHAFAVPELLLQVQQVVASGGAWLGASLLQELLVNIDSSKMSSSKAQHHLTERESEVAACIAEGQSNKEIARNLNITERTVKAHLSSCFTKLKVRDRMQLALAMNKP